VAAADRQYLIRVMPAQGGGSQISSRTSIDVAVVGGGIIGLAVAREARARGLSVAVFDRGELGAGASRAAAGMLAPVAEAEFGAAGRRLLELGLASAAMWPRYAAQLAGESGIDPGLRRSGTLVVARDADEAEALERELAFRVEQGLRVERLRPSEARRREPALASTLRLALDVPDDHSVDPRRTVDALVRAAQRAGVQLRPGTSVAEIATSGGRVNGVALADGERVDAASVVVAAGAWSSTLDGLPAAAGVPVRPVKGQILRLREVSSPGAASLLERVVRFEGGYIVPRGDGRYVLGATVEERGFDETVTAGGIYELLRDASELVPGIWELEVEEIGAGLRPGTPDNGPVVGPGALAGLVWATGHFRNGILLAPLTAELAVDAVTGADPTGIAAACDPSRFASARRALEVGA
jgi:glycine oxidase